MGHAHAVLDLEQRRQQAFEIEMRHAVEIGFLAHIGLVVEDRLVPLKYTSHVESIPVDFVLNVIGAVDEAEIALVQRAEQPFAPEFAHQRSEEHTSELQSLMRI